MTDLSYGAIFKDELQRKILSSGRMVQLKKFLGQVLVELGMITNNDLNTALEKQKSTGQRLGEVLIAMGVLTPEQLEKALGKSGG